jgi:uncharacterized paraquat-inducible protein A
MLHNDRQISHHPKNASAGQLVCPHCQTSFPLTWRRYLLSVWGNHRCPQCKQVSQLKDDSPWLWPIRIAGIMIYVILSINVFSYVFNNVGVVGTLVPSRLFVLFISVMVGLLIDKWVDGHVRHLKIRSY